jgi:predicted nucleic acid-binding protein
MSWPFCQLKWNSLFPNQAKTILALFEQHGLTLYEAAYLELAKRKGFSLATLDSALLKAAPQEPVALMGRRP